MAKKKAPTRKLKPGQKRCPKCNKAVAARIQQCNKGNCTYNFNAGVKKATKKAAKKKATKKPTTTPEPVAEALGLDFYGELVLRWVHTKTRNPEAKQKDYINAKPVDGDWQEWDSEELAKNQEQQSKHTLGLMLLELTEEESKTLDSLVDNIITLCK